MIFPKNSLFQFQIYLVQIFDSIDVNDPLISFSGSEFIIIRSLGTQFKKFINLDFLDERFDCRNEEHKSCVNRFNYISINQNQSESEVEQNWFFVDFFDYFNQVPVVLFLLIFKNHNSCTKSHVLAHFIIFI